ncbi:MAG: ankyrin repeat domain-containing protein [Planctomycetaceae bacterium]
MLANNGFANLVDGQIVHITHQEQLNRALSLACECGFIHLVEELHHNGAEIYGNPQPLCVAAEFDELRIAEYLVEHGADVDAHSDQMGQTPLMEAAGSASLSVCQYLLKLGADTTAVCDGGMTALEWALMGRHTAALPEIPTRDGVLDDYDKIIEMLIP